MEEVSSPFSIFEKAKSFFYYIRWIFCLSNPEEDSFNSKIKSKTVVSKLKKKTTEAADGANTVKSTSGKSINDLPEVCLEEVFKHLSLLQKGKASQVCKLWHGLLRKHCFWKDIDLTLFKCVCQSARSTLFQRATPSYKADCYSSYTSRLKNFINFLLKNQFRIERLKLSFDIIDGDDSWEVFVRSVWQGLNLQHLKSLHIDWLTTPEKSLCGKLNAHTNDLQYKHRHRMHRFSEILPVLVGTSKHLQVLRIPFLWNDVCVQHVSQVQSLRRLHLCNIPKNWVLPTSRHLNHLLNSLPLLQHLEVAVTRFALCNEAWSFASETLKAFQATSAPSQPSLYHLHLPNRSTVTLHIIEHASAL